MKKTDAHPGRPFAELTEAGFYALGSDEGEPVPDSEFMRVVWDWDERTSRGSRRRPAMHLLGLRLDPGDFRPSTSLGADFDEEGNAEGVYFEDDWDTSSAARLLDGIGKQKRDDRFLVALWNDSEAYVGVLAGGHAYTDIASTEWFDGPDWSEARVDAMPSVIADHRTRSGVTIVALDTPVPPDHEGGRDSAGLGGLHRALDDLLYICPFDVLVRDPARGASVAPEDDFSVVTGVSDRLARISEQFGSVHAGGTGPDSFDWHLLRTGPRGSPVGHLLAVDRVLVTQLSPAGDETWDEMRDYGIEGGFDRVVIVVPALLDMVPAARRAERFVANFPAELAEHNQNMTGAIRSVGAQALDTRLQDLHDVWAVLASWEGPVRDDAETAEFIRAYTVPGSDWPTHQQKSSPTIVWIAEGVGNRPHGYLEGLAAAYHPERDLLEINAEFPVFAALHAYWNSRYQKTVHTSEGPERLQEIDYEIFEVVREWCEQTLVEVVVGVNQLAGRPGWDERRIKAALSPEALSGAAMAIHHVQQSIKRSLGQRLGSLKEVQTG